MQIQIQNWGKHNPRADYKSMPWFKCSSGLFRHKRLFGLSAETKWLYVALLCVAAEENKSGLIDSSIEWLADQVKLSTVSVEASLQDLETRGLISATYAVRTETYGTRTIRREENEEKRREENEEKSNLTVTGDGPRPRAPYGDFLNLWNRNRGTLAGIDKLTESRKAKVRARWAQKPDLEYWITCVGKMAASTFCCEGGWASFDWLVKNDTNHVKVAEGRYDNRDAPASKVTDDDIAAIVADVYAKEAANAGR